jgi:S-adenosylmethionine uptake transporter
MALSPNMHGAALMTAAMAGFAISDACMKTLGTHWPLFQSLLVRGCGTTLLLGGMALALRQVQRLSRRDWGLILLRTLCEVAAAWLYLTAVMLMPLANVSAIHQAVPLTVTLAGALVLGERVGRAPLAAILVGFGGVTLILHLVFALRAGQRRRRHRARHRQPVHPARGALPDGRGRRVRRRRGLWGDRRSLRGLAAA